MIDENLPPRFCIGVDLGTTNCVLAYVDTAEEHQRRVEILGIPQWGDTHIVERRTTLPSFLYTLPQGMVGEDAASREAGNVPRFLSEDPSVRVGEFARVAGSASPGRLIASAKSWLSHEGVDRTADLLPWYGDADVEKRSPMAASAAYLSHLRQAWDAEYPDAPMADQDVVIALPASFDEVARELTVQAAIRAGLPRIQLIEEPQAAFYAWIDRNRDDWMRQVRVGQLILVCDIGGGTTDLTLIRVRPAKVAGLPGDPDSPSLHDAASDAAGDDLVQFHRVAVGKHLILGGDNLDLALARAAEAKLDQPLEPRRWQRLVAAARDVKESMLSPSRADETTLQLPGEGSALIGGSIATTMTADEVDSLLIEGFFPRVSLDAKAVGGQSGFQELGLPYASDPAVTKHLAEFLTHHRETGRDDPEIDSDRVDLVLFNGGVLRSPAIRERIVDCLTDWFAGDDPGWRPQTLECPRLDLAVAQGAASFGLVRRGEGVRIAANLARTYFMQIGQSPPTAVCVTPADAQPGQTFTIDSLPMELRVGQPVRLPLWVSSTRLADRPGQVVEIDESEMTALPPIQTVIQDRKRGDESSIAIVIESHLTEIGTIDLYCVKADEGSKRKRWKLEFDIRGTLETDRQSHSGEGEAAGIVDDEMVQACVTEINNVFMEGRAKPSELVRRLHHQIGRKRDDWPPVLLRQIWQALIDVEPHRRRSPAHEIRWLNLLGFSLRPGYGVAVDDWRTSQTWKTCFGKIAHNDPQVRAEALILWRRVAGGLTAGQQSQLASLLRKHTLAATSKSESAEVAEAWRLAGSLERLPVPEKIEIADAAIDRLHRKKTSPIDPVLCWTIGRLATRTPTYGPINGIIPAEEAAALVRRLLRCPALAGPKSSGMEGANSPAKPSRDETAEVNRSTALRTQAALALTQIARRTDDRFRDLNEATRHQVIQQLRDFEASEHFIAMVQSGGQFDHEEQAAIFGDSLPLGIELRGAGG